MELHCRCQIALHLHNRMLCWRVKWAMPESASGNGNTQSCQVVLQTRSCASHEVLRSGIGQYWQIDMCFSPKQKWWTAYLLWQLIKHLHQNNIYQVVTIGEWLRLPGCGVCSSNKRVLHQVELCSSWQCFQSFAGNSSATTCLAPNLKRPFSFETVGCSVLGAAKLHKFYGIAFTVCRIMAL